MEVAQPGGKVYTANDKKNKDLFEVPRGGGNNFGIVTRFTIEIHLARKNYGASIPYNPKYAKQVKEEVNRFARRGRNQNDQTCSIIAAFRHVRSRDGIKYTIDVICPWNGKLSEKRSGISSTISLFSGFKKTTGGNKSSEWRIRPLGWGQGEGKIVPKPNRPGPRVEAQRGRFGCIMVPSTNIQPINEVEKQAKRCAKQMKSKGGVMVVIDIWPKSRLTFLCLPTSSGRIMNVLEKTMTAFG